MEWLERLMMAISLAIRLVPIAEKAFDGKEDTGPEKKVMVMAGTKALIDTMQAVSQGGQAETWQRLEAPIGAVVNATCEVMYPKEQHDGK